MNAHFTSEVHGTAKNAYQTPKLATYGGVEKLTLSGGCPVGGYSDLHHSCPQSHRHGGFWDWRW